MNYTTNLKLILTLKNKSKIILHIFFILYVQLAHLRHISPICRKVCRNRITTGTGPPPQGHKQAQQKNRSGTKQNKRKEESRGTPPKIGRLRFGSVLLGAPLHPSQPSESGRSIHPHSEEVRPHQQQIRRQEPAGPSADCTPPAAVKRESRER